MKIIKEKNSPESDQPGCGTWKSRPLKEMSALKTHLPDISAKCQVQSASAEAD